MHGHLLRLCVCYDNFRLTVLALPHQYCVTEIFFRGTCIIHRVNKLEHKLNIINQATLEVIVIITILTNWCDELYQSKSAPSPPKKCNLYPVRRQPWLVAVPFAVAAFPFLSR